MIMEKRLFVASSLKKNKPRDILKRVYAYLTMFCYSRENSCRSLGINMNVITTYDSLSLSQVSSHLNQEV